MTNFRIRPFSIAGPVPNTDTNIGSGFFFRNGDTAYSCVKNVIISEFGKPRPEQPASELENWTSSELRFFAALYLGTGPNRRVRPYPLPIYEDIQIAEINDAFSDVAFLRNLRAKMAGDSYVMRFNQGLVSGNYADYETVEWGQAETSQAQLVWCSLTLDKQVALRGLFALLKSEMLFAHHQFGNAALAEAHISMDAAHCIVRTKLRELGHSNPSASDAGQFVSKLFGENWSGERFFEDYYIDRIRNVHADNRFGSETIPEYCVDDLWFLQRGLKELYFRLLTNMSYVNGD